MNSKKLIEKLQGSSLSQSGGWNLKTQGEIYGDDGDEKSESDTLDQDAGISSDPWAWCKSGKCCKMPTKAECLCYKEVESVRYFDLHGNWGSASDNIVSEIFIWIPCFPQTFF